MVLRECWVTTSSKKVLKGKKILSSGLATISHPPPTMSTSSPTVWRIETVDYWGRLSHVLGPYLVAELIAKWL